MLLLTAINRRTLQSGMMRWGAAQLTGISAESMNAARTRRGAVTATHLLMLPHGERGPPQGEVLNCKL
jgi:hypothetical protein